MRSIVSEKVEELHIEGSQVFRSRYPAVKFRGKLYIAFHHLDAINLAFVVMTQMQKHRVSNRIADGKEMMLFGSANRDGTEWEWDEEFQDTRMLMYGFD